MGHIVEIHHDHFVTHTARTKIGPCGMGNRVKKKNIHTQRRKRRGSDLAEKGRGLILSRTKQPLLHFALGTPWSVGVRAGRARTRAPARRATHHPRAPRAQRLTWTRRHAQTRPHTAHAHHTITIHGAQYFRQFRACTLHTISG